MQDTIVTAPGSLGDVNPMLAIARVLQAGGRDVLFMAAERYLHLAERAGLRTRSLIDEEQFSDFIGDPELWHSRRGLRHIFDKAVNSFLKPHYEWLEENCEPGKTLLVSHLLDLAGRIYRDKHPTTRLVSAIPAPVPLRSFTQPPRLSGHVWEPWFPKFALPLAYRGADWWLDRMGASEVNELRVSLGLPQISRMLNSWWWSPDLVLGMFPEWFSVPNRDLLPQMKLVGFPLADSGDVVADEVTQELDAICTKLGGEKPVVFAPGTANHHGRKYLLHAAEACRDLNLAAILISDEPSQLPQQLPPRVFTARYLPFGKLLPVSAAIVHHGGVGTTSQALAAGIPQIVLPMAFDQFDNAVRVERLGCGEWLPMQKLNTRRLTRLLGNLKNHTANVADVSARMAGEPSFETSIQGVFAGFGEMSWIAPRSNVGGHST